MKLGNTFYISLFIGAFWASLLTVILTILTMLVSGVTFTPEIGASTVAGLVVAAFYIVRDKEKRNLPMLLGMGTLFIIVFLLVSGFQPFGTEITTAMGYQILALLLITVAVITACRLCLADISSGSQSRYQLELLFIRVMKGFGFVFFTIIVVLPFYVMVMTSVKSQQLLLINPLDFSIDLSQGPAALFRSYRELFVDYHFGTFLLNSGMVSVATVVITLLFSVPGAYAVARLKFPGQAFLSRSILLIYMVPAIVLVIPLYAVFSQLGLRNTLTGLLFVYPATTIPVAVYMLQGYFRGLPHELEEAGLMDGLSRLGVILKITLPLSVPAIASVSLYIFMIAWNEFLFAFMFLDDVDIFTLSRGVQALNSAEVPRQHLMAGAVVATVPVLAIFLWFEKFLVAGLTAGSVKG